MVFSVAENGSADVSEVLQWLLGPFQDQLVNQQGYESLTDLTWQIQALRFKLQLKGLRKSLKISQSHSMHMSFVSWHIIDCLHQLIIPQDFPTSCSCTK